MAELMHPLLKKLVMDMSSLQEGSEVIFNFNKLSLSQKRYLAMHYRLLDIEYAVLWADLCARSTHIDTLREQESFKNTFDAMLILTDWMQNVHQSLVVIPREAKRLRERYDFLLSIKHDTDYIAITSKPYSDMEPTQIVREITAQTNFLRLITARARRLIAMLVALQNASGFQAAWQNFDSVAAPFYGYFSWLFYLPRLISNTILLFQNMRLSAKKTNDEQVLGAKDQLIIQLDKRWFELTNDWVWVIGGTLNTFLFVGGLSIVASYLTLAMFIFDVVAAVVRATVELNQLFVTKKTYLLEVEKLLTKSDADSIQLLAQYQAYLTHLEKRIAFEQKRLIFPIFNTSILMIGMLLGLPAFAATPWVGIAGAILIISITLINFAVTAWLREQNQTMPLSPELKTKVSKLGMFAQNVNTAEPEPLEHKTSEADDLLTTSTGPEIYSTTQNS